MAVAIRHKMYVHILLHISCVLNLCCCCSNDLASSHFFQLPFALFLLLLLFEFAGVPYSFGYNVRLIFCWSCANRLLRRHRCSLTNTSIRLGKEPTSSMCVFGWCECMRAHFYLSTCMEMHSLTLFHCRILRSEYLYVIARGNWIIRTIGSVQTSND